MIAPPDASPHAAELIRLDRRQKAAGFTTRDLRELSVWASDGCRVVIWESEPTPFAMLYEGSAPWATWAIACDCRGLLVWDCVSFADLGRFESMGDALGSLHREPVREPRHIAPVIDLAAERRRRAGRAAA